MSSTAEKRHPHLLTEPGERRKPPLRAKKERGEAAPPPRSLRLEADPGLPRPCVKWVGGKTQLLPELLANVPRRFGAYHEPFVGGAALFFALSRGGWMTNRKSHLSDVNRELVETYRTLRDEVEGVIEALERHRYEREHYYLVRAQDPWSLSPTSRAARLLYLNRTGFNGLYRVNRQGGFNVPFGRYKDPRICDAENLRAVSRALQATTIEHRSFESVIDRARPGDLVYFDPPYVPVSRTANFVSYAASGFGLGDQERLAAVFDTLARRGVSVMLSNSDAPWVRERYRGHRTLSVWARRSVNSKAADRGPVGEVLVVGAGASSGTQAVSPGAVR